MEEYIEIGYTKKTYGIHGAVKAWIETPFRKAVQSSQLTVVFIELMGGKVPFFIDQVIEAGDLIIQMEDINTKEEAVPLTGKTLFVRKSDLGAVAHEEEENLEFLIGYELIGKAEGPIGTIEEILELPEQLLAVLQVGHKEILIPLHDQFITSVDPEKQTLEMDLPEGLLDL